MKGRKNFCRVPKFSISLSLFVVALAVFTFYGPTEAFFVNAYEDIMFAAFPSGQRAYDYGSLHFTAAYKNLYDIQRASYFFNEAFQLDPNLPYIYHQLARIAFLRGDFLTALADIDAQIQYHGAESPNSYYMRGLIEGYIGDYKDAVRDYAYYVGTQAAPDWAALNDYAWVLLKSGAIRQAANVTEVGLKRYPSNVWLLNTSATALYELGDYQQALERAQGAKEAMRSLTVDMWLRAYPGNDPETAPIGLQQLENSIAENIHMIGLAIASSTVQLRGTP